MTDTALHIAEVIRPKLVMDGMFLVGLDIVGDKLMEVNVLSPGGLGSAQEFERVDFTRHVIEALERKVQCVANYRRSTDHALIAMLSGGATAAWAAPYSAAVWKDPCRSP